MQAKGISWRKTSFEIHMERRIMQGKGYLRLFKSSLFFDETCGYGLVSKDYIKFQWNRGRKEEKQ